MAKAVKRTAKKAAVKATPVVETAAVVKEEVKVEPVVETVVEEVKVEPVVEAVAEVKEDNETTVVKDGLSSLKIEGLTLSPARICLTHMSKGKILL